MICVKCGCKTQVVDSRDADEGASVRRRRECVSCKYRFSTLEILHEPSVVVEKPKKEVKPQKGPNLTLHRRQMNARRKFEEMQDFMNEIDDFFFAYQTDRRFDE